MTIACYLRVSTIGQNEVGQRREIQKWLEGHQITTGVRWYTDKDTGDNLDRPAFHALQKDVFAGEVQTVVIWKLDRLSRSLRDGVNTLGEWCEQGIRVVSVTQQLDFKGAMGKMMAALLFGLAEIEQETRRERQRVGIEAAKERGTYRGRKSGTTKVKPKRAKTLQERGLSHAEIANSLGVSRRTVLRYLATC